MTDPNDLNDNSRVLAISNNPGAGSLGTVVTRIATLKTHPAMISDPTKITAGQSHTTSVPQASVHSALLQQQQQQLASLHDLSSFVNQQQMAPGLGQNMSGSSSRSTLTSGVSGDGPISEGLSVGDLSSQALQQQAQQAQQHAQHQAQLMLLQQQQAQQAQAQQMAQQQIQQQVQQQLQSAQSSPQLPQPPQLTTQAPDHSNGEGSSTQPPPPQPAGTNEEPEVLVAPNKDLEFATLDLAQEYALRYAKSVGCAAIVKRTTKDKLGAVVQKDIACERQGIYRGGPKKSGEGDFKTKRCGCPWMISVGFSKRRGNRDGKRGRFTKVNLEHNHPLDPLPDENDIIGQARRPSKQGAGPKIRAPRAPKAQGSKDKAVTSDVDADADADVDAESSTISVLPIVREDNATSGSHDANSESPAVVSTPLSNYDLQEFHPRESALPSSHATEDSHVPSTSFEPPVQLETIDQSLQSTPQTNVTVTWEDLKAEIDQFDWRQQQDLMRMFRDLALHTRQYSQIPVITISRNMDAEIADVVGASSSGTAIVASNGSIGMGSNNNFGNIETPSLMSQAPYQGTHVQVPSTEAVNAVLSMGGGVAGARGASSAVTNPTTTSAPPMTLSMLNNQPLNPALQQQFQAFQQEQEARMQQQQQQLQQQQQQSLQQSLQPQHRAGEPTRKRHKA
ncbi:hypothetical protein BG005_006384 [Podila minutissima]|nr:hypothetical protein BG005_006384 [Podila minutissima]